MSSRTSTPRTTPLVVAGAVVLALALAIAVLGGGGGDGWDVADQPDPVVEQGAEGLAPVAAGAALLADGEVAVPVEGAPTIVVFLAHWCPACDAEVPVVQEWLAGGGLPDGVALRAVATAIDPVRPSYPPTTWLGDRDWDVPTLVDTDGSVAAAYGVDGFPYVALVDADGRLVAGAAGPQGLDGFDAAVARLSADG